MERSSKFSFLKLAAGVVALAAPLMPISNAQYSGLQCGSHGDSLAAADFKAALVKRTTGHTLPGDGKEHCVYYPTEHKLEVRTLH